MDGSTELSSEDLVTALKAAAEPTRLRILLLLATGELNVKDLTVILGQSQPRISRHLKLLSEAGLIERFREGSWVYFHVSDRSAGGRLAMQLVAASTASDIAVRRDRERAEALKRERETTAQSFFEKNAADWDQMRSLYVSEHDVENAMLSALGHGPFNFFVDLGTGTGRTLELFAPRYKRSLGIDVNQSMLTYARAKLSKAGLATAQVRHGNIYALSLANEQADAVVLNQVLHFLSDPALAVKEAARVLAPGGKLLIIDLAPHDMEFLRETQAHERLGFPHALVDQWLEDAGLLPKITRDVVAPRTTRDEKKLTVTLWLAERPQAAHPAALAGTRSRLEEAR